MRRFRGVLTVLIGCITIAYIVFITQFPTVSEELYRRGSKDRTNLIEDDTNLSREKSNELQKQRHVTPSLAELGNRGSLPEMNNHVLMLTRIPGAGGELLVLILQRLQGLNAFKHIRLPPGDDGVLTNLQQELLVEEVTSIIRQKAIPLTFDGDIRFLNFSAYGRQAPTFISLVRDPLDLRTLNRFRNGSSSMIYSGSIPHFCGQDPRCTVRNSKWALERAKANVLRWYPVIGILAHIEETLDVLESTFPCFFANAKIIYEKLSKRNSQVNDPVTKNILTRLVAYNPVVFHSQPKNISDVGEPLKQSIKKRLRQVLAKEVEFYEWLKSRLFNKISFDR